MSYQKKDWSKPTLNCIAKFRSEESVLLSCKLYTGMSGPGVQVGDHEWEWGNNCRRFGISPCEDYRLS